MLAGVRLGLAIVVALFTSACLVNVEQVSDPSAAFARARAEAGKVQGRRGPAHQLNVLAWDPQDQELVRVSIPMWLAREAAGDGELDLDLDDDQAKLERRLKKRVTLEQLEQASLGTLLEVEEHDGERVMVWLR